ncbi:ENTH/ANTH/VHS superfamily protein [Prunus dulcis]|uniref:ENTH/ANTH/VHS superfamily protein n=1 Tax=Prunus dulcis TaxID=3755 RepID=A0A4Y1QM51_PRUDU|nr:ENTH/ANTH/VHS superfamily protein [Prunus dulcis]
MMQPNPLGMAAGSQQSLRKALKTVGLAKANGDFKALDVAIAKATSHDEALPKEKHVLTILNAVSAFRPRAEAAYCIHGLARRLSKTHNWKRTKELDTPDLLRQLPALQQLLSRLLDCQFFEMQHNDAVRALEIYKKSRSQEERLCEFFEICRSFNFGQALKFIKIQQPPASFLTTMEDYVNDAPSSSTLQHTHINEKEDAAPQVIHLVEGDLLIDHKQDDNVEEKSNANGTAPDQSEAAGTSQVIDLLSFDELPPVTSESDEQNSLALAIVQSDSKPDGLNSTSSESSWELALFTAPSSNADAVSAPSSNVASAEDTKVAVGLDRLTLDSLYDGAMASTPNQNGFYHRQAPSNPFDDAPISPYQLIPLPQNNLQMAIMPQQHVQDQVPFYGLYSNAIPTASTNSQMPFMTQQQAFMMQQQQLANISDIPSNSSGNPFAIEQSYSQPPPNSFNGFI